MHLYISDKRLKEIVGIARGKQLKFSAWSLLYSSRSALHGGYDLYCEHWQTFQMLRPFIVLKHLCQRFGFVTLQFAHHHARRVQRQRFTGTGTKKLPNLPLLIQFLCCEFHGH